MAKTTTVRIQLTREQELQLAAATGLLVGTLELDLTNPVEGEIALAQIPEELVEPPSSATPPASAPGGTPQP